MPGLGVAQYPVAGPVGVNIRRLQYLLFDELPEHGVEGVGIHALGALHQSFSHIQYGITRDAGIAVYQSCSDA